MAGELRGDTKKNLDILYDLTPDDTTKLKENDLLDLINFGQVMEVIKLKGKSGMDYNVSLALLWDDDWIDLLKRTMSYANDPVLRVRLLRRLKIHQAIQFIDDRDYRDTDNAVAQRELWALLCHMSDLQIDYLDNEYSSIEIKRNMDMSRNMAGIDDAVFKTAPESTGLRTETKEETILAQDSAQGTEAPSAPEEAPLPETSLDQHQELVKDYLAAQEEDKQGIKEVLTDLNIIPVDGAISPGGFGGQGAEVTDATE